MKHSTRNRVLAAATSLLLSRSLASADPIKYCPPNADNICYQVAIPQSSAQSGSGNIFFQISAPATNQWVALGQGTQMSGSNIFLIYQDGSGNVTSSCRQGEFHQQPPFNTASDAAKLTVLAGSGLSADGKTFVANVACSNCNSWFNGGQMSFTDSKAPWIAAWKSGSSLATTNKAADISQHDDTSQFQLDLTKAVTVSDSNPFVSGSTSGSNPSSGSDGNSGNSAPSGPGGSSSGPSGGSPGGSSGQASPGVVQLGGDNTVNGALPSAHGLIMALTIVVLFPVGAMLMPLFGRWYIHAAWQLFAWLLMWAAFGIAVVSAKQLGLLFNKAIGYHTIIGLTVVVGLSLQPFVGYLQHRHFQKHHSRSIFGWAHIWWGRVMLLLGAINGGLGLWLAGSSNGLIIAYSVIAGVFWLLYVTVTVFKTVRPRRRDQVHPRHKDNGSTSSPGENGLRA